MPSRAKQNVNGDLGELGVITDFVSMGHAVNSLSQSDYGWDAHIHTTTDVLDPNKLPASWKMSGLTAHVQVKNAQSGSAARVKIGSLRAWLAGSKVGTPTFYFFIDQGSPRYASPKMLQKILLENEDADDEKEIAMGSVQTRPVEYSIFNHLLRLWTRYPRVLLHKFIRIDDWHNMSPDELAEEHEIFVGHVFLAWLRSNMPEVGVPPKGLYGVMGNQIIWAAADELSGRDGGGTITEQMQATARRQQLEENVMDRLVEHSQVPETASQTRKSRGPLWPEASLATSYALATSPEAACEEAKRLVRDVMAYYSLCLTRAKSGSQPASGLAQ